LTTKKRGKRWKEGKQPELKPKSGREKEILTGGLRGKSLGSKGKLTLTLKQTEVKKKKGRNGSVGKKKKVVMGGKGESWVSGKEGENPANQGRQREGGQIQEKSQPLYPKHVGENQGQDFRKARKGGARKGRELTTGGKRGPKREKMTGG